MAVYPKYEDLSVQMSDIRRRLSSLETRSTMGNSAINEGALIARDADGVERARFGQLEDGTFGVTGRIVGSDVSGSTISGSEIIGSDIKVMDGSTIIAQLSADVTNGLALRDPSSGVLVPVAGQIFGTKTYTGSNINTTIPANTLRDWTTIGGAVEAIANPTGRWLCSAFGRVYNGGTGNAAEARLRPILVSLGGSVTNAGSHTSSRWMANQPPESVFVQTIITTPPGAQRYLRLQYWCQAGIANPTSLQMLDLTATAIPI